MIASIIVANPPSPNFSLSSGYEDEFRKQRRGRGGRSFPSGSRPRTGADFASRPEIRKMLWHFHGFSARSLPCGINPPLHAQCVPYGTLASAVPLAWGRSFSSCPKTRKSPRAFSEFYARLACSDKTSPPTSILTCKLGAAYSVTTSDRTLSHKNRGLIPKLCVQFPCFSGLTRDFRGFHMPSRTLNPRCGG